jgi:antitoxin (DNA-binding transcriptional repressor) of toxin-antitoxin stability system
MNAQGKFPGVVSSVVTVGEAKTTLSKLIARAEAGEEVVIARGRVPVVKLVAVAPVVPCRRRGLGSMKGLVALDDSFFDPLPDDMLDAWEGKYSGDGEREGS